MTETRQAAGWGLRYRALLALARAALYWERLWPLVAPSLAVATLFIGIALTDLPALLPYWLHGAGLLAFAAAFAWTLRRAWERLPRVSRDAARHRLETDSGFIHRPLAALDDTLLVGADDRMARRLWQRHLERMTARVAGLRLAPPAPDLARHDRWALRAPVLMVLAIGIAIGHGDIGARLWRAVTPLAGGGLMGDGLRIGIWITPPAYTRVAPLFLEVGGPPKPRDETAKDENAAEKRPAGHRDAPVAVKVPQGSTLLAQVSGPREAPDLLLGGEVTPFVSVAGAPAGPAAAGFRAETSLETPGAQELSVAAGGRDLAHWPIVVVADQAPEAEFLAKPGQTGRASLKTEFEARDDYGLASAALVIHHPEGRAIPGGDDEIRLTLPLAQPGAQVSKGTGIYDLSAHPWAGLEVVGRIEVTDGRGQVGYSDDIKFLLPQRTFNHPVARALVDQRRRLSDADPDTLSDVADVLESLAERPDHFFNDTVVFMALASARGRLIYDGSDRAVAEVQKLLWDTALRIEDGDFAVSERELMDLQSRVMDALRQGADTEEVQRLMDKLRQALDDYLKALTQQMARQDLKQVPAFDPNMRSLDTRDLQDILDRARDLARNGAMDAARKLLSELQQALDQIRRGMAMAPEQQQKMQEAGRLAQGLRELTDRQRKLLDETFKRAQRNRPMGAPEGAIEREDLAPPTGALPGQPAPRADARPGPKAGDKSTQAPGEGQGEGQGDRQAGRQPAGPDQDSQASARQESLRRALGDLMLQMDDLLGNIPGGMGEAERAMRDAAEALGRGRPDDAVPKQTEALEKLEKSQNQMAQQMQRRLGPALGLRRGPQGRGRESGRDPFGRGTGGAFGGSVDGDVDVPSRMETRRAREILEELRRRAGDRDRPALERDYIDRLLRQF